MTRANVLTAIALCAALAGCEEKKPAPVAEPTGTAAAPGRPGPGAPGAATTTTTPAVTAPATATVRDEDIPVEADFEEQAEKDIVPGNLDAELTKIEKELAAEGTTEGGALPGGGQPGGATTGGTGQPPGTGTATPITPRPGTPR